MTTDEFYIALTWYKFILYRKYRLRTNMCVVKHGVSLKQMTIEMHGLHYTLFSCL